MKKKLLTTFLLMMIVLIGGPSYGAVVNVYLRADIFTVPAGAYSPLPAPPGTPNEPIMMWGYSLCNSTFTACGGPTVPGPLLAVNENDTVNIHVRNNLTAANLIAHSPTATAFAERDGTLPTSLIIPGQNIPLDPTWIGPIDPTTGIGGVVVSIGSRTDLTSRVRSFTAEAAQGGAPVLYTISSAKPGTYLYQSGTHPQIQVQMGLYGALIVRSLTAGQAYDNPATAYNAESILLYSEIDQELHYSVASGLYGTPPPLPPAVPTRGQRTSTVDYAPDFFLINGQPFNPLAPIPPIPVLTGQTMLLRFLNAGLREKTPTFTNQYLSIIAEDGNLLPYPKKQYGLLLPAGKTLDVLWSPSVLGVVNYNAPLFDRSLNLTNASVSPGGMLVYFSVTDPPAAAAAGGDVTITKVAYSAKKKTLTVTAASRTAGAELTAVGLGGLNLVTQKKKSSTYKGVFGGIATKPNSVIISSSNGSWATKSVP